MFFNFDVWVIWRSGHIAQRQTIG